MKLWFKLDDGQLVLKECRLDRVVGRMCTLKSSHGNAESLFKAGTRLMIRDHEHNGWFLQLPEPCKCCGLTGRLSGIAWEGIVIDGPVPTPPTKKALEAAYALGGQEAYDQLVRAWKRKRYLYDDD